MFSPEVKVNLLVDSPWHVCNQQSRFSRELSVGCHELTNQLISIVVVITKHFRYLVSLY